MGVPVPSATVLAATVPSAIANAPLAGADSRGIAFAVLCGEMTLGCRTDRFIAILGLGLFVACFVGILTSARRTAMASAACLALLAQLLFLSTEAWDGLDGAPLYPHVVLRVLSCAVAAGLAAAGVSFHMRPARRPGGGHLLLAMVPASLAALCVFELLFFISRLPAISPVSLSLSFRPLDRLVSPTLAIFIAVWLLSFLCLLGDSSGSDSDTQTPASTSRSTT